MLDTNHYWLLVTALGSGVFWLLAYILIIYRGFKDESFGMPVLALCGNFAWELIFGLGIERGCAASWSSCPARIIQARNFVWLLFDVAILYTVLKYGRHYFTDFLKKYFTPIVLGGIAVGFVLIYAIVQEFWVVNAWGVVVNGSVPEYLPLKLQGGSYYTGFALNFMMSILFVMMMWRRDSVDGQSVYVAITKWLGTVAAFGFMLADNIQSLVVYVLYAVVFVFDVYYIKQVYDKCRQAGINPWRRP